MSAVVRTSQTSTPSATAGVMAKVEERTSKPIQWATSTGSTVLQHLAATRDKLKGGSITSDDLINSKPGAASSNHSSSNAKGKAASSSGSNLNNAAKPKANDGQARPTIASTAGTSSLKSSPESGKRNDGPQGDEKKPSRRRKANRACLHCQKAHLTCEDSRPCERCVKKGLADSCTDGARKKAKYLLDDEELLALKLEKERNGGARQGAKGRQSSGSIAPEILDTTQSALAGVQPPPNSSWNPAGMGLANFVPPSVIPPPQVEPFSGVATANDASLSQHQGEANTYTQLANLSPSSGGMKNAFGSENASLEYSILSSMLNGIDPSWLSGSPDNQGAETDTAGAVLNNGAFSHMGIDSMPWQFSDQTAGSPWKDAARIATATTMPTHVEPLHHLDATLAMGATPAADGVAAYDALEVPSPKGGQAAGIDGMGRSTLEAGKQDGSTLTNATEQDVQKSKAAAAAAAAGLDHKPDAMWKERVKHIYGDKTRPFPYTEGYHFLIKYVTANLDKADVLRIVRALAIFRPSLIALQMPLTEDDEVFVERSIQRTILEFEKLISFSGTPTVVWRRTCEIVVVGAEFSMLTQWSRDYLTGRYIYEFFEKPSILEYWEKFSMHAFENTAQSIMMPVTLKTSAGSVTRCAACFSIKRDIFDLPSLIVGNFLPILS